MSNRWADQQEAFLQGMRAGSNITPPAFIQGSKQRFSIYHNNHFISLKTVLGQHFPVVNALVGEHYFSALTDEYIRQAPPSNAVMLLFGAQLPAFIAAYKPLENALPYLADVARLEWAIHSAYFAEEAAVLSPEDIADIAPECIADVRFVFHPAAMVVASEYPIWHIWQYHQTPEETASLKISKQADVVLVSRPNAEVLVERLPVNADRLYDAWRQGQSFGAALEDLACAEFELARTLGVLFGYGAVRAIVLPTANG